MPLDPRVGDRLVWQDGDVQVTSEQVPKKDLPAAPGPTEQLPTKPRKRRRKR